MAAATEELVEAGRGPIFMECVRASAWSMLPVAVLRILWSAGVHSCRAVVIGPIWQLQDSIVSVLVVEGGGHAPDGLQVCDDCLA